MLNKSVLVFAAVIAAQVNATAAEELRVGVLAPLSGPAAPYGNWVRNGAQLAVEELNTSGGNRSYKLIIEDDICKGPEALTAYRKLTLIDRVSFVVGPLCQAAAIPLLQAAESDKTLLLTTGMPTETVRRGGQMVFTLLPPIAGGSILAANYAHQRLNLRSFAVFALEDEFGNEAARAFRDEILRLGGAVLVDESYPRGQTDFRTLLAKVRARGAAALFFAGYGPEFTAGMKQIKELGLSVTVFGPPVIQTPDVGNALRDIADPIYYPYPGESHSTAAREFAEKYRKRFDAPNDLVPMYVGAGYDGVKLLAAALSPCEQSSAECAASYLRNINGYAGANGPISFDAAGNNSATAGYEMRVLQRGQFAVK